MYSLRNLSLADLSAASGRLRKLGQGARSLEEAANRVVRFIYDEFGDGAGNEKPCALVRLYKTHRMGELPPTLQEFAGNANADDALTATARCLVLMATTGAEESWRSRSTSKGHQAIPLPSLEAVHRLPMVSQLLVQLGFDVSAVISADPALMVDNEQRSFNVFHVSDALGSPFIPAQQGFVERYGIKSVLGFGGLLPAGEIYAVILFSRIPIGRGTAEMFKTLALATKLALMAAPTDQLFGAGERADGGVCVEPDR